MTRIKALYMDRVRSGPSRVMFGREGGRVKIHAVRSLNIARYGGLTIVYQTLSRRELGKFQ